jgi:hypothetical protein
MSKMLLIFEIKGQKLAYLMALAAMLFCPKTAVLF